MNAYTNNYYYFLSIVSILLLTILSKLESFHKYMCLKKPNPNMAGNNLEMFNLAYLKTKENILIEHFIHFILSFFYSFQLKLYNLLNFSIVLWANSCM